MISDLRPVALGDPARGGPAARQRERSAVVQLQVGGHAPDAGRAGGVAEHLVHQQGAHPAVHEAGGPS